jgi:hypothetical protein
MYIFAVLLLILASYGSCLAEPRATYVPPLTYSRLDCAQLVREARAVFSRSTKTAGLPQSDSIVNGDRSKSTTVRWPKALLLTGDSSIADELALMRGQMVAIEDASTQQQCSIQFERAPG